MALVDKMAGMLRERIEHAVQRESHPVARAEAALQMVIETFGSHPRLARLFMVEALGAGPEFNQRLVQIRADFADLIRRYLDDAVASGAIQPLDTATAASAWFGAVNEVITQWALSNAPRERLAHAYPTIRALLLRGIGAEVETYAR
jgi:AcrR family transcriptional regulator